jgi:two-component system chemotaxis response regulator CheB
MNRIRVLIADDSDLVREMIKAIVESDPEMEVVGEAVDGRDAVLKVAGLRPDVVTMDIEMPVMNGLDAIEQIMAENAVPILVVTTLGDARTAYEAVSRGALDLVVKPDVSREAAHEFVDKLKLLSKVRVVRHLSGLRSRKGPPPVALPVPAGHASDRVVAIAASTGGPDALSIILSRLPERFPAPIVIAQHIAEGFVSGMVAWLRTTTRLEVKVAAEGELVRPGAAYVCPSEHHMRITSARTICFVERRPRDVYRPSCDLLLSSIAESFGSNAVGVILTGMGNDGVVGMRRIKQAGGRTIAQDESSSVIFGMPKLAIEDGSVDRVLAVDEIGAEMARAASGAAASAPPPV